MTCKNITSIKTLLFLAVSASFFWAVQCHALNLHQDNKTPVSEHKRLETEANKAHDSRLSFSSDNGMQVMGQAHYKPCNLQL